MKKNIILLLITLCCITFSYGQWAQVGSGILGEAANDYSGNSISLNSDGSIIAIGSRNSSSFGTDSGQVSIFINIGNVWSQIGNSINGGAPFDYFGSSIKLSADGNIIAIGATQSGSNDTGPGYVSIFKNIGGVWTQIGNNINGENNGDRFGSSVKLSANGNIVAIGAYHNDNLSGQVRIFENAGNVWTQIGNSINGESYGDQIGKSLSLNEDGTILAIGAPYNSSGQNSIGYTNIYKYIGNTWTQIGTSIEGNTSALSISSSGTVLAIGATDFLNNSGHVRIFENIGNTWTQIGQDIEGEYEGDQLGISIDLNSVGNIVAIGAMQNNDGGLFLGHAIVYQNIADIWNPLGSSFQGESPNDGLGRSISLNNDGNRLAISIPANDTNEINAGLVRIYENVGDISNNISGTVLLDTNADGCDVMDTAIPNTMITTTDGSHVFATFTKNDGSYSLFTNSGDFTTTVNTPNYYTTNPNTHISNFIGSNNTDTANFCIEPIGTINNLNISVYPPIDEPRPGFDTSYQIIYNNVGTTQLSGTVTFEFNDVKMQFSNANQTVSSQTSNTLTFNFTDLSPFETRSIDLEFNVFPPPITNIDDFLSSTASISPIIGDNTVYDNTYSLRQKVIGSYDPNDIRVLEGETIDITETDKYLHYIIRFQNTGTASAINVRVENILDDKLDWNTIQLENLSHTGRVEITNGNNVAFVFDNINLPDSTNDEPGSHGYIAYKIKPKSTVVLGDVFNNIADIYFDFNPAIITNTASTEIIDASLSTSEFNFSKFSIYPNPATNNLTIKSKTAFETVSIYDINGRKLTTLKPKTVSLEYQLTIEYLSQGMYFIELQTGNTKQVQKFIKK